MLTHTNQIENDVLADENGEVNYVLAKGRWSLLDTGCIKVLGWIVHVKSILRLEQLQRMSWFFSQQSIGRAQGN